MAEIQGERFLRSRAFLEALSISEKQSAREQAFLASFMQDQFDSTARGTKAYLVGWHDEWERDLEVTGANWTSVDTTLYIIELDVEIDHPAETVSITSEYFSWMSIERLNVTESGTDGLTLFETQEVAYRFTPLPGMVMDEIDMLVVEVDRGGGYAQSLVVELYNFDTDEYDQFTYLDGDILQFPDSENDLPEPAQYLGTNNMVQVRLFYQQGIGTARVRKMRITQTGRFS